MPSLRDSDRVRGGPSTDVLGSIISPLRGWDHRIAYLRGLERVLDKPSTYPSLRSGTGSDAEARRKPVLPQISQMSGNECGELSNPSPRCGLPTRGVVVGGGAVACGTMKPSPGKGEIIEPSTSVLGRLKDKYKSRRDGIYRFRLTAAKIGCSKHLTGRVHGSEILWGIYGYAGSGVTG
jgi:hypothetical protein